MVTCLPVEAPICNLFTALLRDIHGCSFTGGIAIVAVVAPFNKLPPSSTLSLLAIACLLKEQVLLQRLKLQLLCAGSCVRRQGP